MPINHLFIAGAGLMGSGIAQVSAQAGLEVTLHDVNPAALEKATAGIAWSVAKLLDKGKIQGDKDEVLARVQTSTTLDAAAKADLVLEAVFEDLQLKGEVLGALDAICPPPTIMASNTSAIPITELAACTARPDRVVGLHFFSPVPMMQAVEVVRGMGTSEQTLASARELVVRLGKAPIMVRVDNPGFLINRINLPSNLEAMRMVQAGVGSVEEIDLGMRLATGRRMGPFETGDMVGLDVTHVALMALYKETRDRRWYPPMILRRKVKAGHLGRKTGRGWYVYGEDGERLD